MLEPRQKRLDERQIWKPQILVAATVQNVHLTREGSRASDTIDAKPPPQNRRECWIPEFHMTFRSPREVMI